jgi:REP element-mobilizing transposase RayT
VVHRRRPVLKARFPVHVTWRMQRSVWNLRTRRCFTALARAFWGGADRFGFKLVHYSVQGNHLHLLVEAKDERALSRGMNGLGVRVAKGLNRVMRRHGDVLADRYHARILRSPTEARRARSYLLQNARKHYGLRVGDPYTSTKPVIEPDTFLMRRLC